MTAPAHVRQRFHVRRNRAVIAVTIVASRRRNIALAQQGVGMHAGIILGELICRNPVSGHVFSIGVATPAGRGNVDRVRRRARIIGREHTMIAVAIAAHGHFLIAFLKKPPAVLAGAISRKLIRRQRRIEFFDHRRIAVAFPAKLRNIFARGLADIAGLFAHRRLGIFRHRRTGIAAVAALAADAIVRMNVIGERRYRRQ